MWTAEDGALTPLFFGLVTDEMREKNVGGKFFSPVGVGVAVHPHTLEEVLHRIDFGSSVRSWWKIPSQSNYLLGCILTPN